MKTNNKKKSILSTLIIATLLIALLFGGNKLGIFEEAGGLVGSLSINLNTIVKLLIEIALVAFISNLLIFILSLTKNRSGRWRTLSTVFTSLVKYGGVLIGFCWSLTILGVDVSTIFASVGIIALILGFGAESLIADMVTGIFILFENQYNVGDIIEVGGFRGEVTEVGIRTICIRDGGGNVKIINNSDMKNVVNRSEQRSVAVTDVGISYDTDLEQLDELLAPILESIRSSHSDIFVGKVECSGVEQLADSQVILRFVADVDESNIFKGKRILNKELKIHFDKAHIQMPYPQLEVHSK